MDCIKEQIMADGFIALKLHGTVKNYIVNLINIAKTDRSIINDEIPMVPDFKQGDMYYVINENFLYADLNSDSLGPWTSVSNKMSSRMSSVDVGENGKLVSSTKHKEEASMFLVIMEYVLPRDTRLQKKIYKVCYAQDRSKQTGYPSVIRYTFKNHNGAPPPVSIKKMPVRREVKTQLEETLTTVGPMEARRLIAEKFPDTEPPSLSQTAHIAHKVEGRIKKTCGQKGSFSRELLIKNACLVNFSVYEETSIDGAYGRSVEVKHVIILYKSWAIDYLAKNLPTEEEFIKRQEFFQNSLDYDIPMRRIYDEIQKQLGLRAILMFDWSLNVSTWHSGILSMTKIGCSGNVETAVPVAYVFSPTRLKSDIIVIRKWLNSVLQQRDPLLRVPSLHVDMDSTFLAFEEGEGCFCGTRCIFDSNQFIDTIDNYMIGTLKVRFREVGYIKGFLMEILFNEDNGIVYNNEYLYPDDIEQLNLPCDSVLSRNVKAWLIQKLDILNDHLSIRARILSAAGLKKPSTNDFINSQITAALGKRKYTVQDAASLLGKFDADVWSNLYQKYTNGKRTPDRIEEDLIKADGLKELHNFMYFNSVKDLIPEDFLEGKTLAEVDDICEQLQTMRICLVGMNKYGISDGVNTVYVRLVDMRPICETCENDICCVHSIALILQHPQKMVLFQKICERYWNETTEERKKRLMT